MLPVLVKTTADAGNTNKQLHSFSQLEHQLATTAATASTHKDLPIAVFKRLMTQVTKHGTGKAGYLK